MPYDGIHPSGPSKREDPPLLPQRGIGKKWAEMMQENREDEGELIENTRERGKGQYCLNMDYISPYFSIFLRRLLLDIFSIAAVFTLCQ